MAITFVGVGTCSLVAGFGGSTQAVLPVSAQVGDTALACVNTGFGAPTPPAGWTAIGNDGIAQYLYSRTVQSGDPGATFTFSVSSTSGTVDISVYRGASGVGPYSDSNTNLVAPSVTARAAGDWLVCFWENYGNTDPSTFYITVPGAMTAAYQGLSQSGGEIASSTYAYYGRGSAYLGLTSSGATATQTATGTYSAGGATYVSAFSLILYGTAVPLAPTLTAPTNGQYLDVAAGQTFSWVYNGQGAAQTGYYFERVLSGTSSWWTGSAFTGSSTAVTSAATSITFGSGKWTDGDTYTWLVNTANSVGTGTYSAPFTIIAETAPTVTVTAPTGTSTTLTPTVTWTNSFPATAPTQTSYRICVYTSAQYGIGGFTPGVSPSTYDSGVVSSASTTAVSGQLGATGTWRAYVQLADIHQSSAWEYSQFTQSVSVPTAPTLTAAWQSASASVLLTATGSTSFDSQPTYATFFYSDNSGATWQWVRGGSDVSLSTGTATVTDYEIPANATREYYAVVSALVSGAVYTSNPSTTQSATSSLSNWWLKNPLTAGQNITVEASADFATDRIEQSTVNYLLGQSLPVVLFDTVAGTDGSITVTTTTSAAYTALEAILGAQAILLLQSPFGGNWYIRLAITTASASTAQESGTLSASSAASPFRVTIVSYVNVAMPPITS